MPDPKKSSNNTSEQLNKRDLEIILEVNKKAVEIETGVADQNEEIIGFLSDNRDKHKDIESKLDKILKCSEEINKDIFKLQVLFVTGLLSLVVQIVQIFLKK